LINLLEKIILRLRHITELEGLLDKLIDSVPSFQPLGYGQLQKTNDAERRILVLNETESQRTLGRSRRTKMRGANTKSMRSNDNVNESQDKYPNDSILAGKPVTLADIKPYMREFGLDVYSLLQYCELNLHTEAVEGDAEQKCKSTKSQDKNNKLREREMIYLLEDLIRKLEFKLSSSESPAGIKKSKRLNIEAKDMAFSSIARVNAIDIVNAVIGILPHVLRHIESIYNLLDPQSDNVIDEEEPTTINRCSELLLDVLRRIIMWAELRSSDNEDCLLNLLKCIAFSSHSSIPTETQQLNHLAQNAFDQMQKYAYRIPTLKAAILLHKILGSIADIGKGCNELRNKCGEIARYLLSRSWTDDKELKAEFIVYLIQMDIKHSTDVVTRIENYATAVIPAFIESNADILVANPLLNRDTFAHFYKAILLEVDEVLSAYNPVNFESEGETVRYFFRMTSCWKSLISVIKINQKRAVLSVVLKYGGRYVDLFVKKVLPFMDKNFKSQRDDVLKIFKDFQNGTRVIQVFRALTHLSWYYDADQ